MPLSLVRPHPLAPIRALTTACVLALACACASTPREQQPYTAPPPPRPAAASPALTLSAAKVLVLPIQSVAGLPQTRADVTTQVMAALLRRDDRTQWIGPDALRAALRRNPGYADDPDVIPADVFRHHQERYVAEPLGSLLRRYSALMDTRLVLVLQSAQWLAAADDGSVRLSATMVDSRSGNVVWFGEADGAVTVDPHDAKALTSAADALAARMVAAH